MDEATISRKGPTSAARYAADLELFLPRQGEVAFEQTPLELEVSFGEQDFTDSDGFGFKLSFRRAFIEVILEDCEILKEGRYKRSLPKEQFRHLLKRFSEKKGTKRGGARGGFSLS